MNLTAELDIIYLAGSIERSVDMKTIPHFGADLHRNPVMGGKPCMPAGTAYRWPSDMNADPFSFDENAIPGRDSGIVQEKN